LPRIAAEAPSKPVDAANPRAHDTAMEVRVDSADARETGTHVGAGPFRPLGLRYFGDAATV
jgi:hypothetical protein